MKYFRVIDTRLKKTIGACDEQLKEKLFGKEFKLDDPNWGRIELEPCDYKTYKLYHSFCDNLGALRDHTYESNRNLLDSVVG